MIELRPDPSNSSSIYSDFSLSPNSGRLDYFDQMQHEVACVDAAAQVGGWIEDWITSLPGRVASYVYSKLPTLSLPGAYASTPCDEPPVCKIPDGSYKLRCNPPSVTYLPKEGECELTARCETMFEGLPLKQSSIRYTPGAAISPKNLNGTLVASSSGNTVAEAFQRLAIETGGLDILSPSPDDFIPAIEKAFVQILKDSDENEPLDLVFVLDTTASMGAYIKQVKDNLVKFLEQLQERKNIRVAILEYRDSNDFLNRVNTPFTKDLKQVEKAVQSLTVYGGGDLPEAVLDALLAAKNDLSWDRKAKRAVLLVGDAPPHPKTKDGRYDESEVVAEYRAADTHIAVYPVIAKTYSEVD